MSIRKGRATVARIAGALALGAAGALLAFGAPSVAQVTKKESLVSFEGVFQQHCASCHYGAKDFAPPLYADMVVGRESDVRKVILEGQNYMPGFRYVLDPAQVDGIIAYLATQPEPFKSLSSPRFNP